MPINVPPQGGLSETGASVVGVINKWGDNIDVDIADGALGQVIWPIKATTQAYLFLDAAIQLYIESNDAADNPSGIGAKSVTLKNWQGADGTIRESVTLDTAGLGQTALPELSFGVFSFEVEESGSNNSNVGTIDIVDGSGNVYATIRPGEGRTQIAVQRIPNNLKGVVKSHKTDYARTVGNNGATMRLRKRKVSGTVTTLWDPILTTVKTEDTKDYFVGGLNINSGEWVYWECIGVTANDTPLRGSFDIELENIT